MKNEVLVDKTKANSIAVAITVFMKSFNISRLSTSRLAGVANCYIGNMLNYNTINNDQHRGRAINFSKKNLTATFEALNVQVEYLKSIDPSIVRMFNDLINLTNHNLRNLNIVIDKSTFSKHKNHYQMAAFIERNRPFLTATKEGFDIKLDWGNFDPTKFDVSITKKEKPKCCVLDISEFPKVLTATSKTASKSKDHFIYIDNNRYKIYPLACYDNDPTKVLMKHMTHKAMEAFSPTAEILNLVKYLHFLPKKPKANLKKDKVGDKPSIATLRNVSKVEAWLCHYDALRESIVRDAVFQDTDMIIAKSVCEMNEIMHKIELIITKEPKTLIGFKDVHDRFELKIVVPAFNLLSPVTREMINKLNLYSNAVLDMLKKR